MAKYSDLLLDPRWQRRRLEILQRSDFSCEACGATDKTLHVHHRIYRSGAMPWEYGDDELQSLCKDCHENETQIRGHLKVAMSKLSDYDLDRLLGYAQALVIWGGEHSDEFVVIRNSEHALGISDAISALCTSLNEMSDVFGKEAVVTSDKLDQLYKLRRERNR